LGVIKLSGANEVRIGCEETEFLQKSLLMKNVVRLGNGREESNSVMGGENKRNVEVDGNIYEMPN
jgi:hypothetical protein